jgi:hypothetical protein
MDRVARVTCLDWPRSAHAKNICIYRYILGRLVFEALSEEAVRYMCPGGVFFLRVLCVWLCAAAAGFRPRNNSHLREGLAAKRWRLLGERKRQTKVQIDFEIMARCT